MLKRYISGLSKNECVCSSNSQTCVAFNLCGCGSTSCAKNTLYISYTAPQSCDSFYDGNVVLAGYTFREFQGQNKLYINFFDSDGEIIAADQSVTLLSSTKLLFNYTGISQAYYNITGKIQLQYGIYNDTNPDTIKSNKVDFTFIIIQPGSSKINIQYDNSDTNPFTYSSSTSTMQPLSYEISISGSNKTSFGNCFPTTNLSVECTGLFSGYFTGNTIATNTFTSDAVDGVEIYTGKNPNTGYPNPLKFIFSSDKYTDGVCQITIEADGSSPTTINLIDEGLPAIDWIWDASINTWYSTIILKFPSEQVGTTLVYNIQYELKFILRANTDSSKNQTWLEMNGQLNYSSSPACPNEQDQATVSGKMKSIAIY
jgi:hypothetical protein